VDRLHLPFPVLVGYRTYARAGDQAADFHVAGMILLKRMALVIENGVILKAFYRVFPPDKNAEEVIAWLRASREAITASGIEMGAHGGEDRFEHRGVRTRVWCCSASSDSREQPDLAMSAAAPCANGPAARRCLAPPRSSCAIRPSVTMAVSIGISAMTALRNWRRC